jgi:dynein heavy chain, axonemal
MEEFEAEAINRVSTACTAICMWVRSMYKYYLVVQVVEPKRRVANESQQAYQVSQFVSGI